MKWLDKMVSVFDNHFTKESTPERLRDILLGERYKAQVEEYRNDPEPSRRKGRKSIMPCFTPCGIFAGGKMAEDIAERTGIICIDLDEKDNKDNPDFANVKEICACLPWVMYCGHSLGGKGFFILIPVRRKDLHAEHYAAALMRFRDLGFTPDEQCANINHLRAMSYDPEPYVNEHAKLFEGLRPLPTTPQSELAEWELKGDPLPTEGDGQQATPQQQAKADGQLHEDSNEYSAAMADMCLAELEQMQSEGFAMDIADDRREWVSLSYGFANIFGEDGRELYHRYSSLCPAKYKQMETDKVFTDALTHGKKEGGIPVKGIGHFFNLAKGIIGANKYAEIDAKARAMALKAEADKLVEMAKNVGHES